MEKRFTIGQLIFIIVAFLLISFGLAYISNAQPVTVDLKDLPPSAAEQVNKVVEAKKTVTEVSSWAGMGKEIGEAISSGLMSVVGAADKFGNTQVGYFTMGMIAFSILGTPIMACILELLLILAVIRLSRMLLLPRKVVDTSEGFWGKKTYSYQEAIINESDGVGAYLVLSAIVTIILSAIILINGWS